MFSKNFENWLRNKDFMLKINFEYRFGIDKGDNP